MPTLDKNAERGILGKPMESALQQITAEVLVSYDHVGGLNNADGYNLPSKRAIAGICEEILEVLFPGFHDEKPIRKSDLAGITERRIRHLATKLEEEIAKSLRVVDPRCPKVKAGETMLRFFHALPSVRELLSTDIHAAFEGDPAALNSEEIILAYPCIEAIAVQRIAHLLSLDCVPLLPRMMTEWAHARTGIDIHPGAKIGSHFFIDHGTGVVIGETCRIGRGVKLYHGVTLGARSFAKDEAGKLVKGGKRHPDVGDDVTIYPNATILGGSTTIGENSTIGANVFLMHSVPAFSLVIQEQEQVRIMNKKDRNMVEGGEWSI